MDFSSFPNYPIFDSHIHFGHPGYKDRLISILDQLHIQRLNIACTFHPDRLSTLPEAMFLKAHYPERVYVFGEPDIPILFTSPETAGEHFAQYVDRLIAMGCDGVKMVEGKPQVRQEYAIPDFDGNLFAPFWEKLSAAGIPLIFHVNDPEEFWDAARIPDWARQLGWFYGDGTFIDNEVQYRQVLNVLDRHPDLRIIFAHFFFLSAQLPRLANYLEAYPQICVDLTPGIEMYHHFSADPQAAREFFIKYQDRIIYGTDIGAHALLTAPKEGIDPLESQSRVFVIRNFLETEGELHLEDPSGFVFWDPEAPFRGINLPPAVLEKIYFKNFERFVGTRPRPLKPAAIAAECDRLIMRLSSRGMAKPGGQADPSIPQMVKSFFESGSAS